MDGPGRLERARWRRRERWLTVNEAAAFLGIRPKTLYSRVYTGVVEARKEGGRVLVKVPSKRPPPPAQPTPKPPPHPEATLTTVDVAAMLGVGPDLVRQQAAAGRLRAYRQGTGYRFRLEDVEAFMEVCRIEPGRMGRA